MIIADEAIAAALDAALQSPRFADRWRSANLSEGNCFVIALLVAEAAQTAGYPSAVVHGAPTLQRPPYAPYAHAWVEVPVTLMAGTPSEATIVSGTSSTTTAASAGSGPGVPMSCRA